MSTPLHFHIARLKARNYPWPVPWEVVEDLCIDEGYSRVAYQCIAGVWSIGWAETEGVTADMVWTDDQADYRFFKEVCRYTARVEAMLTQKADQNQLGAMVRFAYNVGLGDPKDKRRRGFWWSSVRRFHNEGRFADAARAFGLQNQFRNPATGKLEVSEVLTRRRAAEAALYLKTVEEAPAPPMPQAVEAERKLPASPTVQAATVGTAVGAVTVVSETTSFLAPLKQLGNQVLAFTGLQQHQALALSLVLVGAVVLYWRYQQRKQGHA